MARPAPESSNTVYPHYFGLKEASFSITPDPQYLYLSDQHREALAHLLYGTGDSGGFVLLTGEVGTGKTTVCRAFLEQLPEHVDVALILNPALTGSELLQTVCHEFGAEVPEGTTSTKVLIDRLNAYLLDAHAKGRRPVLMIDEAQNLAPDVLEQIRLLTNLETPKHKLLQIFLVGQPELRELLRGERLRQLDQRITARFHIMPFTKEETAEYIRHRLAVAGVERRLFTPAAVRRIYHFSEGVPRLINILCDRALLGAYATRSNIVNSSIVARAVRELRGEQGASGWSGWGLSLGLTAAGLALIAGIGWMVIGDAWPRLRALMPAVWVTPDVTQATPGTEGAAAGPETAEAESQEQPGSSEQEEAPVAVGVASESGDTPGIDALLGEQRTVLAQLLRLWRVEVAEGVSADLCILARSAGLRCRSGKGSWDDLRSYGRPAVIPLDRGAGEKGYALVVGIDDSRVTLALGEKRSPVPREEVDPRWSGEFLLLWQPPPTGDVMIGASAPPDSVRWLRQRLAQVGPGTLDQQSNRFDRELTDALRKFQSEQGIAADGIAGPETLIRLNRVTAADTPRLISTP